ncbi:MAG: membrane protein insertase YidC [Flavobacteriales bacterium]|nr:membrane protein insertase YidC [Flavobacteriales bacterium]
MEQKGGLDINFFIGMCLIFGLLMWWSSSSINTELDVKNNDVDTETTTPITPNTTSENEVSDADLDEYFDDSQIFSYHLSNDDISVKFSNYGASVQEVTLKNYRTYDSLQLNLIEELDFNLSFFINNRLVNSNELLFSEVTQDASRNLISFTYQDLNKNSITFIYKLLEGYQLTFEVLTETENTQDFIEPDKLLFSHKINQLEKNIDNERNTTTIRYSFNNKSSKQMPLMKDSEKNIENPKWVAYRQQFFSTIISSESSFGSANLTTSSPDSDAYVKTLTSDFSLEYDNRSSSYVFNFYFLPNKYSLLKSFDQGFESLVPLGWGIFGWVNKFLVIPMFNVLEKTGLNYGLIILIIALVIKMLLFLPTKSSYLSMAKMRVLKPEIDAINEKVKDPMERQQAQMNLYKKTGVNPLGGCLPLLFQMPVLIALFRFFPASIELRQQPFLWADDLSTYDSIFDFGFHIPLYGDHISLFALLMTLATVLQMKYSNQSSNAQMPQMKYIMYLMPVIFLFVMNNYSAALSYYYFLANLITFGQQWIIRKNIDDDKLYAMLQANKKKPVKKSKFQQKLEEIAKKNQQNK